MERVEQSDEFRPAAEPADRSDQAEHSEQPATLDRGGLPIEPGRRTAEHQLYRGLVDSAYGAARGARAPDAWAEAAPKLHASWEILKEKYGQGERTEPTPQADGDSSRGKGGRAMDAAQNAEIDRGYERIREVGENVIVPRILRVAAEDPSRTLAGFDHRIKGEDRLKEKVADRMRSKGRSAAEVLAQISDVVRFTFIYGETAYAAGVRKDVERLEVVGFTQVECRNTWTSDQYKGVNSQWLEAKSGVRFEVQFHTQASLEAKELTHEAYERIRTISDPTPETDRETAELRQFQQQANAMIPIPPSAADIEDYPSGGN
jgi:hypothetical protein